MAAKNPTSFFSCRCSSIFLCTSILPPSSRAIPQSMVWETIGPGSPCHRKEPNHKSLSQLSFKRDWELSSLPHSQPIASMGYYRWNSEWGKIQWVTTPMLWHLLWLNNLYYKALSYFVMYCAPAFYCSLQSIIFLFSETEINIYPSIYLQNKLLTELVGKTQLRSQLRVAAVSLMI